MTLAKLAEALRPGLEVRVLDHARQRSEGVLGALQRDGELVALCAHRCQLTSVGALLDGLGHLERLDVGDNELQELPALPAQLRELYIYDNQLSALPALPALQVLDANRNRLTDVPELHGIEFVYLAANRLTRAPTTHGVRYLNVSDNPLSSLWLDDPTLAEVRAESCGLRELELAPSGLGQLRELSLRGNALASLPSQIAGLAALQHLDLRANLLDDLPVELAALPALRKLDLRWNPLRRRPPWLAELELRGCAVYV
jgi:Leucine-rich repeat (LRR) protein